MNLVIDTDRPTEAARAAIAESVMRESFDIDTLLNEPATLASAIRLLAHDNALHMASLDVAKDGELLERLERLHGLFADLNFILTRCQIVVP